MRNILWSYTNQIGIDRQNLFVKNFMENEKYIYLTYILHVLVDATVWNTCNISMHIILIKKEERTSKLFNKENHNVCKCQEFRQINCLHKSLQNEAEVLQNELQFMDMNMIFTNNSFLLYFFIILADKIQQAVIRILLKYTWYNALTNTTFVTYS